MAFNFFRSEKKGAELTALSRSRYKDVWTKVSGDIDSAKMSVSGYTDEAQYVETARMTLDMLGTYVGVHPTDVILEIGAGVGRVGSALAPRCKEWIGADVSPHMVRYMKERLKAFPNARAIEISGYDLAPIPDNSIDMVYCTVVFMHLDEWDRYAYIKEGMRVLKPGGRMLVDNVNLASDLGWKFFMEHCAMKPEDRPANISKTSTPQELEIYFTRAGFEGIEHHFGDLWVIVNARKPAA
jgi:ubiquinone/menaquinone biosynthesis C-methylase UbiE